jgi:molecular chaperone GrpE
MTEEEASKKAGQEKQSQEQIEDRVEAKEQETQQQDLRTESELQAAINEAVEAALAEQRDSVLRAQAEVQNMRRRCEADVEKAHKFALEKFTAELLRVMDNMEWALQAVTDPGDEKVKSLCEGIELTQKEFLSILNKFNIEQINPEGQPFDPQVHEAMSMVENPNVEPNTVMTVVQKGYSLHGRVIRPAMVLVSK